MKLYVLVFLVIFLPLLAQASRCESYFEGMHFEHKLQAMGVKYILEHEDSFGSNETVATILPDTETYLGRQALELMQYPVPTILRVGRYNRVMSEFDELNMRPHAFYTGYYPFPKIERNNPSQVILVSDALTLNDVTKVLLKHEMEHARLRGQAQTSNAHVLVSHFYGPESNLLLGVKIDVEEVHVYTSHAIFAAELVQKTLRQKELLEAIYEHGKTGSVGELKNTEDAFLAGVLTAYTYSIKTQKFFGEIDALIQKNAYKLKKKNEKTWAIFTLSNGIEFYMPVNEIHPSTHSMSEAQKFVREQFQRLKALVNDYVEINGFFLDIINGITEGDISRERAPEILEQALRMYKLPDRIDSPHRKPISSHELIRRLNF